MQKSKERVEAGELARIALCVGRVAQEKGVEAVYEPHPLQRFRLTLMDAKLKGRSTDFGGVAYGIEHYLDPSALANYRDDLADFISREIETMTASLDKYQANSEEHWSEITAGEMLKRREEYARSFRSPEFTWPH